MNKRLLSLLAVIFAFVSVFGCNSSSSNSNSDDKYAAQITCDEEKTTLQLVRLSNDDWQEPKSEVINAQSLGYGALKFMLNQGSVPDEEDDVPDFCKYRSDLGEEDAGPCVLQPLLDSLSEMAAQLCIEKEEIAVDISYNTGGNVTYPQQSIDSLDDSLNLYILGLGYEVETDSLKHYSGAYNHQKDACLVGYNWMAALPNDLTLSRISLPGTHDTMAHYGGDAVQTQSMRLWEQLYSGIRALDIRCRHYYNTFTIHHGEVYQHANFDDVLETAQRFLRATDYTETIIMRVTEEYEPKGNTVSFAATFLAYASKYPGLIWGYDDNNPTLGQVRGKVVILQDFLPGGYPLVGIPWGLAVIQDAYKLENNWDLYNKWEKVYNHLGVALVGDKERICINFLSGSTGSFPYFVASGKSSPGNSAPLLWTALTTLFNPNTYPDFPRERCFLGICSIDFLGTNCLTSNIIDKFQYGRVGIIMADFPGPTLIYNVMMNNFKPLFPS
jgi:1-phosphatidylinositol phosphodiesterase